MHLLDALNLLRSLDTSLDSSLVKVEFSEVTTDRDKATTWAMDLVSGDTYGEWFALLPQERQIMVWRTQTGHMSADDLWTVCMSASL